MTLAVFLLIFSFLPCARHSAKYSSSNLIFTIVLGACYGYHSRFGLKQLNNLSKVTELEGARAVSETLICEDSWVWALYLYLPVQPLRF